jgi:hypothetical protein
MGTYQLPGTSGGERRKRLRTLRQPAVLTLLLVLSGWSRLALAQGVPADIEALKKTAPRIYLDCATCDLDYIRTEITFVNYVRDRNEAQVHVLVTTQATGSGGREYTLTFLGRNEFQGANDIQKYFSNKTDTADEVRQGLVRALKIGLMSYVARTPIAARLSVTYTPEQRPSPAPDRWDSWVFAVSGNGYFSGEQSTSSRSLSLNVSANRVTPELKVRLSVSGSSYRDHFKYEGEAIESLYESYAFNGLVVKSLNEHWSAGAFLNVRSSSYDNIRFSISPSPALEYNVYPYSLSTRRQLRILYTLGFDAVRYREVTIYDKRSQNLLRQSLAMTLDVKEKWGSVSTTLEGAHYFYDISKYHLELFTNINLQLFRGVNVFAFGGGSRIHDQIFLPRGEASFEDVILQRRQLETGYNYFFGVGLSYTFGSIYTNVVNSRFGAEATGGVSITVD